MAKPYALRPTPFMMHKINKQSLAATMPYNPFTWSQGIKREIANYGATLEREIAGIDWANECLTRITFKGNQTADLSRSYLMIEDDMSFMEPIFMEKQLPFPEYIVKSGYHAMTQEVINKYEATDGKDETTKRSALEAMLGKYGKHFRAIYTIPCKGGAEFSISVISGKMFYSRTDAPYEIMGVALDDGEESGEPMPYQTDEELMIYLAKVIAKAQEY